MDTDSIIAAVQSLLSQCAPQSNLYECAATEVEAILRPNPWSGTLHLVAAVLFSIALVVKVGLLARRIRRGQGKLLSRTGSPGGHKLILPRIVDFALVCQTFQCLLSVINLWTQYGITLLDTASIPRLSAMNWTLTVCVWAPFVWQIWADLVVLVHAAAASKGRLRRLSARQALLANVLILSVPLLLMVPITVIAVLVTVRGATPYYQSGVEVLGQLQAIVPEWSGELELGRLLPLIPFATQDFCASQPEDEMTVISTYITLFMLLWLIWLPFALLQIRTLRRQTRLLGSTDDIRPESPTTGTADAAERRLRYLLRVCKFRIWLVIAVSLAMPLVVADVVIAKADLESFDSNTARNVFVQAANYAISLLLIEPAVILAAAFQVEEEQRDPSVTISEAKDTPRPSPTMLEIKLDDPLTTFVPYTLPRV